MANCDAFAVALKWQLEEQERGHELPELCMLLGLSYKHSDHNIAWKTDCGSVCMGSNQALVWPAFHDLQCKPTAIFTLYETASDRTHSSTHHFSSLISSSHYY